MLRIDSVIRSYAWDPLGRQLYVKSGSSVWYEITDPHGDVAALATATALVGTEHFDVWGNLLGSSGTTVPFGYQGSQGSWTDATTGFVSMGARWYYPKVGQFLSSDPAAGIAGVRIPIDRLRWIYGANSPLDVADRTGLVGTTDVLGSACDPSSSQCQTNEQGDIAYFNQQRQSAQHAAAAQHSNPHYTCSRYGCLKDNQVGASPDLAGGAQNLLIWAGRHLPGGARDAYVETVRVAMNVDAGATARVTGDASALINYVGDSTSEGAAVIGDLRRGDYQQAQIDLGRYGQTQANAAAAVINGASQANPEAFVTNTLTYGAGLVNTYRTNGAQAVVDQVSYDFGYNAVGGGAESALMIGLGGVLGPEAFEADAPAQEASEFTALPKYLDDAGNLTNGTYTINDAAMASHMPVTAGPGKSVFLSSVDAHSAVLDAAQYADEHGLWVVNKAKVRVLNGPVGILGDSGYLTDWINVYRRRSGFIHGSPGTPGV